MRHYETLRNIVGHFQTLCDTLGHCRTLGTWWNIAEQLTLKTNKKTNNILKDRNINISYIGRCLILCHNVQQCSWMFWIVWQYSRMFQMFSNVPTCFMVFRNVSKCFIMFQNISQCRLNPSGKICLKMPRFLHTQTVKNRVAVK